MAMYVVMSGRELCPYKPWQWRKWKEGPLGDQALRRLRGKATKFDLCSDAHDTRMQPVDEE